MEKLRNEELQKLCSSLDIFSGRNSREVTPKQSMRKMVDNIKIDFSGILRVWTALNYFRTGSLAEFFEHRNESLS